MGECILIKNGVSGTSSDDCTASRDKVLSGYTAVTSDSNDEAILGTMVNRGSRVKGIGCGLNSDGLYYYIPQGYYSEGSNNPWVYRTAGEVSSAIGLNSSVLRSGCSILGVNGDPWVVWTGDASAEDSLVRSGYTYWKNGAMRTGTMSIQGADVPNTDRAYATSISAWEGTICSGVRNEHRLEGVNWIQTNLPNFYSSNIREGVNMGGLVGTMKDYSYLAAGQTSFSYGTFFGVLRDGARTPKTYESV